MDRIDYKLFLAQVKEKIENAQIKTALAANSQMLYLYWQLGNLILKNQANKGWGAKIVQLLAKDINKEFPNSKGFSVRNLQYMRKFSENYYLEILGAYFQIENELNKSNQSSHNYITLLQSDNFQFVPQPVAQIKSIDNQQNTIVQQPVAQIEESIFLSSIVAKINWSHHIKLMDKEPHLGKRLWYMLNSFENGISRNILAMQIESNLFERQVSGNKINNFNSTLPPVQSDFANYLLKDPYIFDFVQAKQKADERDIEEQLTTQITKFLLELGQGFAFVGRQVKFTIGNQDFYADLIFYHIKLRCYVVVELKARPFEPGDASQLNFYLNVVNEKMKTDNDNDTIGLLLCKGKNNLIAEYSLKGYSNAIGISDYVLSKAIPDALKSSLPQIEDIENELKETE
ncbi:MAG: PDDEXK nuclease domain-containing protein [Limnohabitans sp.]|nr:PDDEXK nuclease domain-containing protein [Limnohabitans sp.]